MMEDDYLHKTRVRMELVANLHSQAVQELSIPNIFDDLS